MKFSSSILTALCLVLLVQLSTPSFSSAADWPTWRHDAGRSGVTDEHLPAQLHLQWSRKLPQLKPAWPEDVRLQFDASYQPIVVGKLMVVASSRNDSVTAYDTGTGEQKWRFFADAPVRFAPVAHEGSIYFGADDGCLYRLDPQSGTLISKWNATPSDRLALGNDRLISVWPVRCGPVIVGDTLYFTVGVWPFEGTYLTTLDLDDDDGELSPLTPLDNTAPQGYLASNGNRLVIPCGRANALCRDLASGKRVSVSYSAKGLTDHHAVAHEDWMFHGSKIVDLNTGKALALDAHRPLISDGKIYFSARGKAHAYDLRNPELVEKLDRKGQTIKVETPTPVWRYSKRKVSAVHLKTANQIFAHHENEVFSIVIPQNAEEPSVSFSAKIEGTCSSMLAADGKLFAVTKDGRIYCFGPDKIAPRNHGPAEMKLEPNQAWSEKVDAILEQTETSDGYCLALGIGSGDLIEELVWHSGLTVIAIDPDAETVEAFRRRMDAKGLYGTRVTAIRGTLDEVRLPPYLANLIVSEDIGASKIEGGNIQRAFRTLRPYGGLACIEMTQEQHDAFAEIAETSKLPNAVVDRNGSWTTYTREGALPGSADWTHEYGDASNTLMSRDTLVKAPLGVLWFGGPSSDGSLFYDRHQWGPGMAVIEGRMLIQGGDKFTAVDVYTGRILWQKNLNKGKGPGRRANWGPSGYDFVAVEDAIYLAYLDRCLVLDPKTGEEIREIRLPEKEELWGRIRIVGDLIIVPVFPAKGEGNHPIKIVGMNRTSGEIAWTETTSEGFPMVAAGKDTVYAVEGDLVGLYVGADKKRRSGIPVAEAEVKIRAFDARNGAEKWSRTTTRIPSWIAYSEEFDVLVSTNKSGIDAWYGGSGDIKWSKDSSGHGFKGHPENYYGRVILWKDQVIDQRGPGLAYDLDSGESIMREHPLTGDSVEWSFTKSGHHCNYAIASEHLLTFRAADAGFADLESGATGRFVGFRSGCRNSLIPANGVLNAPNMAFGCKCSYSIFTSLALMNIPESDLWTYSAHKAADGPIEHVGINFGARGDRTADNGTLWMDYPNVGGSSPDIPVKLATDNPQWFRLPSTQVSGDGLRWVAASGVSGVKSIAVPVVIGKEAGESEDRTYTVRLTFVEPDTVEPGQRTFDVLIQGELVEEDLDVVEEAGGSQRMMVKEFQGIKAGSHIVIAFTPKTGQPMVSGVEVVAEAKPPGTVPKN